MLSASSNIYPAAPDEARAPRKFAETPTTAGIQKTERWHKKLKENPPPRWGPIGRI